MKVSFAFMALLCSVQGENNFTVLVHRRFSSDIYHLNSEDLIESCLPETVYLIQENQCIRDADLFHGMYTDDPMYA